MNRRSAVVMGSVLVIAMTLGLAGVASADPKCSEGTLDGFYVFTASGFQILNSSLVPVAIVEQIRFDGAGAADVPGGRIAFGDQIFTTQSTGTYTIGTLAPPNKGCEGTLTFPGSINFYMFIPPDAQSIQLIRTDPGAVFRGTATRVSK
jgi:hypothetical protein